MTRLLSITTLLCSAPVVATAPYNVVLALTDDQGWTDTSVQMDPTVPESKSDYYETPSLERLARQGMRFSAAYSPAPICSPARISILTGKSPQALHLTDIIDSQPGSRRYSDFYAGKRLVPPVPIPGIPREEATIAEFIKAHAPHDYATGHFGKWHLGAGGPGAHGFDVHDGNNGNNAIAAYGGDPDPKGVFGLTAAAIEFMTRQVAAERPFYLQLSHYADHIPLRALRATEAKYKAKRKGARHAGPRYAAMSEDLDTSVGRLLDAIDELGIRDRTYLIYVSDNGGSMGTKQSETSNAPLAKGKTWVYEGGIRVPMFVQGPGVAAGSTSAVPVIGWDLFPTVCELAGCSGALPRGLEGGSLVALLTGKSANVVRPRRDALVWHFPHYLTARATTPQSAIRNGDWKLVREYESGKDHLFNLAADIGETRDLAALEPARAGALATDLDRYLSDIGAALPVRNTHYGFHGRDRGAAKQTAVTMDTAPGSPAAQTADRSSLVHRYSSTSNQLAYRYPRGWTVMEEGLTDWIAQSAEKMFWGSSFDPRRDAYYAVSSISPFLTDGDARARRIRAPAELAKAAVHSLTVAHGARVVEPVHAVDLGSREAAASLVAVGEQSLYQVFLRLGPDRMATVAARGPQTQLPRMRALVDEMARTVEPR